jgi:hypothetical protein
MSERSTISPEEGAELEKLQIEYWDAVTRAAEAMHAGGDQRDSAAWQRVLEEDARAGRAINRMKEIWFGV